MRRLPRVEACAAAGAALLIVVAALVPAACGGVPVPAFPEPPTAAPTWPSGASPKPAITYPVQPATTRGFHAGSDGWRFQPTVAIEVSALGFYDDGRDGLRCTHRAAIFDAAARKPVVETAIESQSPLDGAFRWEPVGPVVLKAGHEYVMVWDSPPPFDPGVPNPENASLALEVRYLGYRETASGAPLWCCPEVRAKNVVLSGNFKYRPVSAGAL